MTFQAGIVSNPNGRPKGTGHRQQVFNALVEPHREELFKKAIDMALTGNEAMLRLFLDRMLPAKPTGEPIQIEMPPGELNSTETLVELGKTMMRAVTSGQITPEDATQIAILIRAHRETYLSVELCARLEELRKKIEEDNKRVGR